MKKTARITLAALALAAGAARAEPAGAEIGKAAPGFTLSSTEGKEHSLADFKGKFVVLEWTNYDCPFVAKHYGADNMQALQREFTEKGVVWLSINSSAPGKQGHFALETWKKRMSAWKVAATAVLLDPDGKVGRAYGAKVTPHLFIVNPEGVLIYAGAIDDRRSTNAADIPGVKNYVRAALEQALAGRPVETPSTQPYGCSVKY